MYPRIVEQRDVDERLIDIDRKVHMIHNAVRRLNPKGFTSADWEALTGLSYDEIEEYGRKTKPKMLIDELDASDRPKFNFALATVLRMLEPFGYTLDVVTKASCKSSGELPLPKAHGATPE